MDDQSCPSGLPKLKKITESSFDLFTDFFHSVIAIIAYFIAEFFTLRYCTF